MVRMVSVNDEVESVFLSMTSTSKLPVSRISVSLPEPLLQQLDQMVEKRGFESRSQAIAEMISQQLTEHMQEQGDEIMAGTITLVYDHSMPGLQTLLTNIQHEFVDEVISSLHVPDRCPHHGSNTGSGSGRSTANHRRPPGDLPGGTHRQTESDRGPATAITPYAGFDIEPLTVVEKG